MLHNNASANHENICSLKNPVQNQQIDINTKLVLLSSIKQSILYKEQKLIMAILKAK